jgi:hypothetical protein
LFRHPVENIDQHGDDEGAQIPTHRAPVGMGVLPFDGRDQIAARVARQHRDRDVCDRKNEQQNQQAACPAATFRFKERLGDLPELTRSLAQFLFGNDIKGCSGFTHGRWAPRRIPVAVESEDAYDASIG